MILLLAFAVAPFGRAASALTDADLKRMRTEQRVALVVGNARYVNFQALDNPVNDARGVAQALEAAGFKVVLATDASRADMLAALDAFSAELPKSQVALFYFAGHAAQVDWRNFMVPVAATLDATKGDTGELVRQVEGEAVDLGLVLERMAASGNDESAQRLNIVILDACRDNPFTAQAIETSRSLSRSAGRQPLKVAAGLAQTFAPPGTFLAYSTAPGQVASDGRGANSPYSAALIAALKEPALKLEDVFKQVRNQVAKATSNQQIPWDNSSVFRDFYFRVPTSLAQAGAAEARSKRVNSTFVAP